MTTASPMTNEFPTLKAQNGKGLVPNEDRGDYVLGDAQDKYLRTDWTLDTILSMVRQGNEPMKAIDLSALNPRTWTVLLELLSPGTGPMALADMKNSALYQCHYTDQRLCSLLPLYLVTLSWEQYVRPGSAGLDRDSLMYASSELEDGIPFGTNDQFGDRIGLSRVQQCLLGTGYTMATLPSDGSSVVNYQFAELTNGDILILAGYEWFNK